MFILADNRRHHIYTTCSSFQHQSRPIRPVPREFPMPTCTLCETPLTEGAGACPACGTSVAQTPTTRAGSGQARVALDAARRAHSAEGTKGVDLALPTRLVQAGGGARARGDCG